MLNAADFVNQILMFETKLIFEISEMKGLRCLGSDKYCCTEENKCDKYEGHCEGNDHCKEGLACGTKNCKIDWHGKMDFDANDNCCKEEGSSEKILKFFFFLKKTRLKVFNPNPHGFHILNRF